jgi:hypothetical protein
MARGLPSKAAGAVRGPFPTARGLLCLLLLAGPVACWAAEAEHPEKAAAKLMTPQTDRAIERGLAWLAAQQHDDGSFGTSGMYRGNVAVVGLCGMAMIANGSTPGRGPYGRQTALCLDFVLSNTKESGYIVNESFPSHGPMYGHGFATVFVAECYGSTPRPEIRDKLSRAVKLIVNTQNDQGGWRYFPQRMPADISVTVAQLMALRAARNAGIDVPRETIDRSVGYLKKSQNSDGGFAYMLETGRESQFPRSAAAVVGLQSAGIYEAPEVAKGITYLFQFLPKKGTVRRDRSYYFYGHYYAAIAMWQAGGDSWSQWYPAIRDELVSLQRPNGSWADSTISPEFDTAMACLVLQVPNNLLPIFQR